MAIGPFRVGDKPMAALAIDLSRPDASNPITGFSGVEVTVLDPDKVPLVGFVSSIVGEDVLIEWPEGDSVLDKAGIYTIQATLSNSENREAVSPVAFQVLPTAAGQVYWASVADVKAVTGKDVDESTIARAQFQVEILVGVLAAQSYLAGTTPAEGQKVPVSYRDSQFLKMGVAYQAAWLVSQPDVYDRNNVENITQDGVHVQYADQGLILAPLAKKALNRVSWLGSRSVSIGSGPASYADYVEYMDDRLPWTPLGA